MKEIWPALGFNERKRKFLKLSGLGVATAGCAGLGLTLSHRDVRQGTLNLLLKTPPDQWPSGLDYYLTRGLVRSGYGEFPQRTRARELVLAKEKPEIEGFITTQIVSKEESKNPEGKYKTGFLILSPNAPPRFFFEKLEKPGSPQKFFANHPYSKEKVTLYFPSLFASNSLIYQGREICPLTRNNEHPLVVVDNTGILSVKTYEELEQRDLMNTVFELPDGFFIRRNPQESLCFEWKADEKAKKSINDGLNYNYLCDVIHQDGSHHYLFITCGWYSRIHHHDVVSYLFSFASGNPFISEIRTVHMDSGSTRPIADRHLIPDLNSGRTILYYDDWEPALNKAQYGLMAKVPLTTYIEESDQDFREGGLKGISFFKN